jgi:hypothetical protein
VTDAALAGIYTFNQLDRSLGNPVEDLTNSIDAFAAGIATMVSGGADQSSQESALRGGCDQTQAREPTNAYSPTRKLICYNSPSELPDRPWTLTVATIPSRFRSTLTEIS